MEEDTATPDAFPQLVDAYADADDPEERRLFLRAALRRLEVGLASVHRDLSYLVGKTTVKP